MWHDRAAVWLLMRLIRPSPDCPSESLKNGHCNRLSKPTGLSHCRQSSVQHRGLTEVAWTLNLVRSGLKADSSAVTPRYSSIGVLDRDMRAIPTANGFTVPLAPIILVLDGFRITGKFLLCGG
jgi:hypothetical protein